ncbi:hypothetical protein ABAC460_00575 [Asticcacaulis sp. AC460]|uniref:hypothetical protein n=1 Tax=Asticcacaulis sp. AC460 TaxID=1282360 RepID=UPI0003C3FBA2|nr:hypothetical protein [Asticcacaulis sp. AC460]ESQ93596.1 hypothetical protein ABAC460_00575 [Asticcacaulis sp. AC460]
MDAAAVFPAVKAGGRRIVQVRNTLVRFVNVTALPNDNYAARRVAWSAFGQKGFNTDKGTDARFAGHG